ncbi:MAG TPA: Flp pilus assembly protein CpaB [Pseudonocardiaceae bacterium]
MSDTGNARLAPLPADRLAALLTRLVGRRRWPRVLALRRLLAVGLIIVAGVLALRPAAAEGPPTVDVLVAAHDLAPGRLAPADLTVRRLPGQFAPAGALSRPDAALGHVLDGPVRAGEPITDVRLLGPAATGLSASDPDAASVPVRLADPGIADLLRPGSRVDVVTSGATSPDQVSPQTQLLASDASVVAVLGKDNSAGQRGCLVVLALPRTVATRVAVAALDRPIAVTLR